MQRILVELIGASEDLVEQCVLARDIADEEGLGELTLVLEMIEESAFGNPDCGDQLLDRGGRKSLFEYCRFGRVEDALARISALPLLSVLHGRHSRHRLYHECS